MTKPIESKGISVNINEINSDNIKIETKQPYAAFLETENGKKIVNAIHEVSIETGIDKDEIMKKIINPTNSIKFNNPEISKLIDSVDITDILKKKLIGARKFDEAALKVYKSFYNGELGGLDKMDKMLKSIDTIYMNQLYGFDPILDLTSDFGDLPHPAFIDKQTKKVHDKLYFKTTINALNVKYFNYNEVEDIRGIKMLGRSYEQPLGYYNANQWLDPYFVENQGIDYEDCTIERYHLLVTLFRRGFELERFPEYTGHIKAYKYDPKKEE